MPTLMALLLQLTYCATSFARLGFDFHMPLLLLFEDAVCTRVSSEFFRAVEEFACTPEMGWAANGALWGERGRKVSTVGQLIHFVTSVTCDMMAVKVHLCQLEGTKLT